ncbi:MAG: hypothetical protein KKD77_20635, partial [Gammaproteobacteria bacterium]|nr:hypothetical protein [Gammaproteobacteria bacterium]
MKKVLLAVAILGLTLNAYAWDSDSGWQPSLSTELTNLQTDINSSAGANFTTDVSVGGDVSVTGNVSTARLDLVGAGGNITGNEYGQYIDFGKVPNAVLVGGTSLTQGLTVLNTGYVGIGKTNPSQELQILDIGN